MSKLNFVKNKFSLSQYYSEKKKFSSKTTQASLWFKEYARIIYFYEAKYKNTKKKFGPTPTTKLIF